MTRRQRAIRARDAILPLLKARGTWRDIGPIKVLEFRGDGYRASLRTPFQRLPEIPEHVKYLAALYGPPDPSNLPYGLDVWSGRKVLKIEWADDGRVHVATYKPGAWENTLAVEFKPT